MCSNGTDPDFAAGMHVLDTERLTLRWLEPGDSEFILELTNDPDWLRHIGDRGIRSLDDAARYIADGPRAMYERVGFGLYCVMLRGTGTAIGLCGPIKRDWLDDVDIGFAFLPAFRGRGYALEAAAATLEYGTTTLGLHRIAAIVSPGNADSLQLLGRLGMRLERMVQPPHEASPLCLYVTPPPG
jgi:RimJ/RimL family protein N-acetyltransferase